VTSIIILTRGLAVQREVLAAAMAKFGTPTKQEIVKLDGGLRGAPDGIDAHWEVGNDIVIFSGGNSDSGILEALSGREVARQAKVGPAPTAEPQL
jgi:hypothetical protein